MAAPVIPSKLPSSSKRLKRKYDEFNEKYFENRLPANTIIFFDDTLACGCFAETIHLTDDDPTHLLIPPIVRVNLLLKLFTGLLDMTILHEMVHILIHPDPNHGKTMDSRFNQEMLRLAQMGAFCGCW